MSNTVLSFSFDGLLKELENILNAAEIKKTVDAAQYESSDYKEYVDRYLTAVEGISNEYTYRYYDDDVLRLLGYSDEDISEGITKATIKSDGKLTKAIELQNEYTISNYVEHNSYYRQLHGLPDFNDTEFFYASVEFYNEYGIEYKPVHEFTAIEISQLKRYGEYDLVVTNNISDIVTLTDGTKVSRNYLKHLGSYKIDIKTAREAKNYELLFTDTTDLNEFLFEEFKKIYDNVREYYIGTLYNKDIASMIVGYDRMLGVLVLSRTIQTLIVKTIKYSIERNYFDLRTIRLVYNAYNIPFNPDLSMEYHKSILRNINYLIEHKASDHCITELFNILSSGNIGLYRYYLVKNHKYEDGKPIFIYTIDDDGNRVLDKEAIYDFYFQSVDIRVSNVVSTFKEVAYYESYDSVVSDDQYWINDQETKNKLLESKFNYIESKYLGISIMKQMTKIIFETQYAIRLIMDKRSETEKLEVYVEEVGSMDLFTCIVCICALFCKKFSYVGNIISDATQIYSVYGFNVKADITSLMEEIKTDDYYTDELDNIFKSISVNSKEDLDTLFKDIIEFRELVINKMYFASTIQEYRLYSRLYRTILVSDESNEMFTKSDGTIASTYLEWLLDKDRDLYLELYEMSSGDIPDKIDAFLNAIVDVISSLGDSAYLINDGDSILIETLIKLVMFFKSYTTDVIKLNTNSTINDINNKIKFLDEIYEVDSRINIKSNIRGSFHSLLLNTWFNTGHSINFTEKMSIEYDS